MNKGLLCLMSGLLVFALLAGCLTSQEEQGWKWYESERWGFRIKYPTDWYFSAESLEPSDEFDIRKAKCVVFEFGISVSGGAAFIVASKYAPPDCKKESEGFGVYKAIEELKEDCKKEGSRFEVVEIKNITLDGKPAAKVIYSIDGGKETRVYTFYKIHYQLGFFPPDFDKYQPIFEEMISSFEFI